MMPSQMMPSQMMPSQMMPLQMTLSQISALGGAPQAFLLPTSGGQTLNTLQSGQVGPGVAGPTGGTAEKPVGLVFHALAGEHGTEVVKRNFPGDRARIRWFASQQALDMVRRKLM